MKNTYFCGMKSNQTAYWTAFYTKPRSEKKVAERLLGKGHEIYCPTRTVMKQWSDRKKKVSEPVFTSYIFARVEEISRTEILMDSGVVSNVFWLGKPAIIRDSEIESIRNFLEEHTNAECYTLAAGDCIAIDAGPLSGQSGVVSRVRGNKAYLSIASLSIELHAEVQVTHLKKVQTLVN